MGLVLPLGRLRSDGSRLKLHAIGFVRIADFGIRNKHEVVGKSPALRIALRRLRDHHDVVRGLRGGVRISATLQSCRDQPRPPPRFPRPFGGFGPGSCSPNFAPPFPWRFPDSCDCPIPLPRSSFELTILLNSCWFRNSGVYAPPIRPSSWEKARRWFFGSIRFYRGYRSRPPQ